MECNYIKQLENLCRICLNTKTNESLKFIFDKSDNENIEKMLKVFSEVRNYPEFPQHICLSCYTNLKISYEFRELCIKSYNRLLENINNESTQTKEVLEFPCEKCDEGFRTSNDLIVHRNQNQKTSKRSEEDDLKTDSALNIKIESHQVIGDFTEESIVVSDPNIPSNIQLPTKKDIKRKLQKDSVTGKPQCKVCLKIFTTSSHLYRHESTHSNPYPFACPAQGCEKKFSRNQNLRGHMVKNHLELVQYNPIECNMCLKKFSRKEHLRRHLLICQKLKIKEKNLQCELCNKCFVSETMLLRHIAFHNKTEWKCKYCSLVFENQDERKMHIKENHSSEEKQFLCNLCGRGFTRNDYLRNHLSRHTGEKPFKCKFCDKGFPRSGDLKVHEKYHIDEKNHICDTCGKKFTRSYNLVIHRRVHTGERPYLCPHCPKTFTQSNDMKAHIRRHTGERFWCELCNEGFIQMYRLNQHKKISHGIEVPSTIKRLEKFVLIDNEENNLHV